MQAPAPMIAMTRSLASADPALPSLRPFSEASMYDSFRGSFSALLGWGACCALAAPILGDRRQLPSTGAPNSYDCLVDRPATIGLIRQVAQTAFHLVRGVTGRSPRRLPGPSKRSPIRPRPGRPRTVA